MERNFDWTLRTLPKWTPASKFGPHNVVIEDGLLSVDNDVYLMINKGFGADEGDPGVGAILWAQSRDAALLVYAYVIPDEPITPTGKQPPEEVIEFRPVTYGSTLQYHKGRGERGQEQTDFRFPEGTFTHTILSYRGRHYYFPSLNPATDEGVIGIRFDLPIK